MVAIGVAGADAGDQRAREHRAGLHGVGQRLALERVLAAAGGRQDDPAAALAVEAAVQAQVVVALGPVTERAAEAAVQYHHLPPGPAVLQLVQQPLRLDAR